MMYDKLPGLPAPGSALESVFVLVYLERKQTELLGTRALVQTSLPDEKEAQNPAIEAYQQYCDAMFPFIERAKDKSKDEEHEALKKFVSKRARIQMHPIYKAQAEHAKKLATLKKFKMQPKSIGASY